MADPPTGTSSVGGYQVTVRETDDIPGSLRSEATVDVGGSSPATSEFERDSDWFRVTLEAGQTYRIDLEGASTGRGTNTDPVLDGIYSSDGRQIPDTRDHFHGEGANARLFFTPDASGTYWIAASGGAYHVITETTDIGVLGGSIPTAVELHHRTGTYTLSVTDVTATETPASTATTEDGRGGGLRHRGGAGAERRELVPGDPRCGEDVPDRRRGGAPRRAGLRDAVQPAHPRHLRRGRQPARRHPGLLQRERAVQRPGDLQPRRGRHVLHRGGLRRRYGDLPRHRDRHHRRRRAGAPAHRGRRHRPGHRPERGRHRGRRDPRPPRPGLVPGGARGRDDLPDRDAGLGDLPGDPQRSVHPRRPRRRRALPPGHVERRRDGERLVAERQQRGVLHPSEDGTYYIVASSAHTGYGSNGTYEVSVRCCSRRPTPRSHSSGQPRHPSWKPALPGRMPARGLGKPRFSPCNG